MKLFGILLLGLSLICPYTLFAEAQNTGFVQGIWYSKEPVFAHVPTRIYVAIRNNTEHDLIGTVRFTDNGTRIGSSDINTLSGRLIEAWVDWEPTPGTHTISAEVSNAELYYIGGKTEKIDTSEIVIEDVLTVDYDTDGDGIGNEADTDDDNDTVLDDDEHARGTNPLVPNPLTEKSTPTEVVPEQIVTQPNKSTQHTQTMSTREGLEKFVSDSKVTHTLLSNATDKIERAKVAIDSYRETRTSPPPVQNNVALETEETPLGTYTSTSTDTATITRTQLNPEKNFLASLVSGVASLLTTLWGFVLFMTSTVLSYPAVLEAMFLLLLLFILYRVARRLGRRKRF